MYTAVLKYLCFAIFFFLFSCKCETSSIRPELTRWLVETEEVKLSDRYFEPNTGTTETIRTVQVSFKNEISPCDKSNLLNRKVDQIIIMHYTENDNFLFKILAGWDVAFYNEEGYIGKLILNDDRQVENNGGNAKLVDNYKLFDKTYEQVLVMTVSQFVGRTWIEKDFIYARETGLIAIKEDYQYWVRL